MPAGTYSMGMKQAGQKEKNPERQAASIALIYFAFAALWILFSDSLLALFIHDTVSIAWVSVTKGLVFVTVTSIVLYILIRRQLSHLARARQETMDANRALREAYDATIEALTYAIDLKDEGTEGHSRRAAGLALDFARWLHIPEDQLEHIYRGALLHDIGKIGVSDAILLKRENLTEKEWNIMRQHADYAYHLLSRIEYLKPALDIPWCHHERWDGSGYPRGIAGESIPLSARLFAIVDAFDALIYDRPYHKGIPVEDALQEIERSAGTHFDPLLVSQFVAFIRDKGL